MENEKGPNAGVVSHGEVLQKEWSGDGEAPNDLGYVDTLEIENYHGLDVKTVLVYVSVLLIIFVQLVNLVGTGAFARNVALDIGGLDQYLWLDQAIVIVTCVLGPPVSQAADLWGRKWFLVITTGCGFVGAMIISRATSMGMAIAGQVILALAYASQPLLYAVASEILPRRYRPAAQGGLNIAIGVAGILALIAGSAMVVHYHEGFRVFWYFVAAILAASAIICGVCYNPPPRPLQTRLTTSEKLKRLDWVGFVLLAFSVVLVVMGLTWAENPYPWKDAHVLAPLLIGVGFLVALIVHQTVLKKDGLYHHDLFKGQRNFAIAMGIMFTDGAAFFAVNGYFALEVSILYETNLIRVGLRFSILFFAGMVGSLLISFYSSYTKNVRYPITVSFTLFVIFFALMASAGTGSSKAVWCYPIIVGLGLGFSLTCLVTIAQLSTPPALIAITSGLLIAIRSLGGAVGLAIYSSIFNTAIAKKLPAYIANAVVPLGLPLSSLGAFITALSANDQAALMKVPGISPQIIGAGAHGLQEAYAKSLQGVWICAAVLSAVAALSSLFFQQPKVINMHVDAPLDKELTHE